MIFEKKAREARTAKGKNFFRPAVGVVRCFIAWSFFINPIVGCRKKILTRKKIKIYEKIQILSLIVYREPWYSIIFCVGQLYAKVCTRSDVRLNSNVRILFCVRSTAIPSNHLKPSFFCQQSLHGVLANVCLSVSSSLLSLFLLLAIRRFYCWA